MADNPDLALPVRAGPESVGPPAGAGRPSLPAVPGWLPDPRKPGRGPRARSAPVQPEGGGAPASASQRLTIPQKTSAVISAS